MVKGVALFWPIFREEAVAQRVIAYNILDLPGSRQGTGHPASPLICSFIHSTHTHSLRCHQALRGHWAFENGPDMGVGLGEGGSGQ